MNEQERIAFDQYMQNVDNELQRFNEMVNDIKTQSEKDMAKQVKLEHSYKDYNSYLMELIQRNKGKNDDIEIPLSEQEWRKSQIPL